MPVIGTYNMSFASDKGLTDKWPSEAKFLEDNCTGRSCWENALNNLKDFIKEKKPLAVGLQEMNLVKPDDGKVLKDEDGFWKKDAVSGGGFMGDSMSKLINAVRGNNKESGPVSKYTIYKYTVRDEVQKGEHTGTAAIDNILRGLEMENDEKSNDLDYNAIHGEVVVNEKQKPAVTIIYKAELGELVACKIMDNSNQNGRPILFALIENDKESTLLISMHGAQDAKLIPDGGFTRETLKKFDAYMTTNNKEFLQGEIEKFLTDAGKGEMKLNNLYIMGDFNDRFGAIQTIELKQKRITAKYRGTAPKSCCYNYDSMGKSSDDKKNTRASHNPNKAFYQGIKSEKEKAEVLNQPNKSATNDKTGETTKVTIEGTVGFEQLKNTGNVENYFNEGDKIFAYPKAGDLYIYKYDDIKDKPSDRSDHELVFMDTESGGVLANFGFGGAKKKTKKKRRKGGMSCGTKHKKKSKKTKRKGGSNCSKKNN